MLSSACPSDQAHLRSHSGPGSSGILLGAPMGPEFSVVFERLRLPLKVVEARCECGTALNTFGRHRAACSHSGRLKRRAVAPERTLARICRETGATVAETDFGQTGLGPSLLGAPNGGGTPKRGTPKAGARKGGGPKISRFFIPFPPPFRSLCVSGGSSRGILVVFGSAGPSNVHVMEFSGCCVKPRRPRSHKQHTTQQDRQQDNNNHNTIKFGPNTL